MLQGTEIAVTDFSPKPSHGPSQQITNRINLGGGDQPGMIACLSELLCAWSPKPPAMSAIP
jgi:hypothetical protein